MSAGLAPETGCPQLRILFVCGADFRAPSEKQVLWCAEELLRRGHRVMVSLAGDPRTAAAEGANPRLELHQHRFRVRSLRPADVAAAVAFAPSLIHAYNSRAPVVAASAAFASATGAPVFVHWEDDEWSLIKGPPTRSALRRLSRALRRGLSRLHPPAWYFSTPASLRWVGREALALDALTPTLAAHVAERLGRDCSVLLPVDPPEESRNHGEPVRLELPEEIDRSPMVAYTGQIHSANVDDLRLALRAVAKVQRRGRDVSFVQCGGTMPGLDPLRLAEQAGLRPGSASFLGYLSPSAVRSLLERAALLVQPGRPSDFNRLRLPSKLQGYLKSGTPTITYAAGMDQLLEDRSEALMTYTDDPHELADRIVELLDDPDLSRSLGSGGRAAASRLFDPQRNVDALLEHYRRWLASLASPERHEPGPPGAT